MGKEYQSSRPRKSASTMFRIFERAGLGTTEKIGRTNTFKPDIEAIKSVLDMEESSKTSEIDKIENISGYWDFDEEQLIIKISTENKSKEKVKSIWNRIIDGDNEELELR